MAKNSNVAARARLRRRSGGGGGGGGVGMRRAGGGGVVGEEGRADSTAENGFTEVLAKNPNRNT